MSLLKLGSVGRKKHGQPSGHASVIVALEVENGCYQDQYLENVARRRSVLNAGSAVLSPACP